MPTVEIGCFHGEMPPVGAASVVAVDVFRASTTAVTAAAGGRDVWPVDSEDAAWALRAEKEGAIMSGELGGDQLPGFDIQNSPVAVLLSARAGDPVILLSTSGSKLMVAAAAASRAYVSCLRNSTAQAEHLLAGGEDALILGAGTGGAFRVEDRICAARIAHALIGGGYHAASLETAAIVESYGTISVDAVLAGDSVRFLRDSGQMSDARFVLDHVDDLDAVFELEHGRLVERVVDRG